MPEVGAELNEYGQVPQAPGPYRPAPPRPAFDFGHAYNADRIQPASRPASRKTRHVAVRAIARFAGVALVVATVLIAHRTGALDRDYLASTFGFGIEQVSLTGHRFTSASDLFDALDLKSARSLATFDPVSTRTRFERLPWVQSVEISRVWPSQLAIRVTERQPFAIWERGESAELVDVTGRQLGPIKRDAVLDLPRISGEGANAAAAQLFAVLDRYPAIRSRLLRAERLSDRRWTLELTGGGRIHLPSDGETSALARLAAEPQLAGIVAKPGQIIDLRSPSKIAIRAAAPTAGGG